LVRHADGFLANLLDLIAQALGLPGGSSGTISQSSLPLARCTSELLDPDNEDPLPPRLLDTGADVSDDRVARRGARCFGRFPSVVMALVLYLSSQRARAAVRSVAS